MIKENATVKVAAHSYVIPDMNAGGVPNIGIIVGDRATLVIPPDLVPEALPVVRRVAEEKLQVMRPERLIDESRESGSDEEEVESGARHGVLV